MRSPKSPAIALGICVLVMLFEPRLGLGLLALLVFIVIKAIRYVPDEPKLNVDAMRQAGGLVPDEVTL